MKRSYQIVAVAAVLAITLVFVFQNCGQAGGLRSAGTATSGDGGDNKVTADEISSLYAEIEEIVQRDLRCSTDADCEAVGLGAKACGGPTKFIIVSTLNAELEHIDALVSELEQKQAAYNQASGAMSTCEAEVARQPTCQQNICQ